MKLPGNVRVKIGNKTALVIYPNIYLPKKVFENLKSAKPDPKNIAILLHEQEHIKRQSREGWFKWGVKYIFSRKFRFSEELVAIKASLRYRKIGFDVEKEARILSGWLYLWPVSYKTAKRELEKMWGEI